MSGWLHRLFGKKEASAVDASFVKRCEQDTQGARAYLAADQARLAKEIEDMFSAYDDRLASLAERVGSLSDEELAKEMEAIRSAQDALRSVARRFQAALKSTDELNRELDGWNAHSGEGMEIDPDHPVMREEVIRSELALRDLKGLREKLASRQLERAEDLDQVSSMSEQVPGVEAQECFEVRVHDADPVEYPDEASLIRAIRDAARETARWDAVAPEQIGQDAIDQAQHLKHLHAILKRVDRAQGKTRERFELF